MTLKNLVDDLSKILEVHPETKDAAVWFEKNRIGYVVLDNKHKPPRIVFEVGL